MPSLDSKKLYELQNTTQNIRNICIVAHVDHGKTTLADSLISSNGIISPRMAGKLRYLDSRPDEQERGITMKSSSITLYHAVKETGYLINLIDSPGHVDFSSEVSTAIRLCDGAIVLVDVVEGVCPQTRVALKQAYSENIKPVLVLNKIDRLIVEMKLEPLDAYIHLTQILEQVNAVMGELFATDVLENEETSSQVRATGVNIDEKSTYDWTSALEDSDDSNLYFAPEAGNVVFASAIDGWGFTVSTFAKLFSDKLGVKEKLLNKVLWGDFYLNSKTKRFMKGAQEKAKKPLFVQIILDNIWSLYDTIVIRNLRDKIAPIADKLGIKLTTRDLRHTDTKVQLQSIMCQWLPLSKAVLNMVAEILPSPKEILPVKVEKLMCSNVRDFNLNHPETQKLKDNFLACSSDDDSPVIVFISKMFPVDRKSLPENKSRALTPEEMARRREIARQRHAERQLQVASDGDGNVVPVTNEESEKESKVEEDDDVFVAFARIFSGKLKKGSKVYVLGPKHDPAKVLSKPDFEVDPALTLKDLSNHQHITCTVINHIYLLMGRELEELDEAVAGNIIGIGGLEEHVLKTATLSDALACPSFSELQFAVPIVRVAVETQHPADLPKLLKGLKLLNQADACVQVLLQETGEHVLLTAGEVHLERCLEDLRVRYAKVPISVSEPIVPFRETIVEQPKTDMVNEDIDAQNVNTEKKEEEKSITLQTTNKQSTIKLTALPLPLEVTALLDRNADLLKIISSHKKSLQGLSKTVQGIENIDLSSEQEEVESQSSNIQLPERTLKAIEIFKQELKTRFQNAGKHWEDAADEIWSAGPRNCGPNVLLNRTKDYKVSLFDFKPWNQIDSRQEFENSFLNGFQLATLAGPLCDEPMMGLAFCVDEWSLDRTENEESSTAWQPYGSLSGQIMSVVRDGCRKAFQMQPQRLMAAMYSCNIIVNQQVLGRLYAVLGRRHGRVLGGDLTSGSASFRVSAALPVAESFRFAEELRTMTSGLASPQLLFSHFEVIDIDPFWTPQTEEEYLHFGEKADSANRAKKYVDTVRRRKGLHVDDKIVEFAEKQRTLSRKK